MTGVHGKDDRYATFCDARGGIGRFYPAGLPGDLAAHGQGAEGGVVSVRGGGVVGGLSTTRNAPVAGRRPSVVS